MVRDNKQKRQRPGPAPELIKLDGDWRSAMKKALKKKPASANNKAGKKK